jgi:aspartyl-tRNA(Asn)/glutamyl-tRNA(Gln) amidotransferase subunit B
MIIADFPDKAMAYRKGKKGLLGFFMGELMKRTRGKADPAKATLLFQQVLDEG